MFLVLPVCCLAVFGASVFTLEGNCYVLATNAALKGTRKTDAI